VKTVLATIIGWIAALAAYAQPNDYRPDILLLDGIQDVFIAPHPAHQIANGSAVELWVEPDWEEPPAYDPVILANLAPGSAPYVLGMRRDKGALLLVSGAREWAFDYNFADGRMHHVALNHFADGTIVVIDGKAIGETASPLPFIARGTLWLGSLGQGRHGFMGAIAALRIWNTIPPWDVLMRQASLGVLHTAPPSLTRLSAFSDFSSLSTIQMGAVQKSMNEGPALLFAYDGTGSSSRIPQLKEDYETRFAPPVLDETTVLETFSNSQDAAQALAAAVSEAMAFDTADNAPMMEVDAPDMASIKKRIATGDEVLFTILPIQVVTPSPVSAPLFKDDMDMPQTGNDPALGKPAP